MKQRTGSTDAVNSNNIHKVKHGKETFIYNNSKKVYREKKKKKPIPPSHMGQDFTNQNFLPLQQRKSQFHYAFKIERKKILRKHKMKQNNEINLFFFF